MGIRTPYSRANGLGAANEGATHHWRQIVTSVALLPLTLWFVWSLVGLAWQPYEAAIDFIAEPHNAVFMLLFIMVGFVHLRLGMQSVIDDYVHERVNKMACLILNDFFCAAMGLTSVLAVLKVFILAAPA